MMKRVRLFSVFTTVVVVLIGMAFGCCCGCTRGKRTESSCQKVFAEFRGEAMHESQPVTISRTLWISATGDQRAVVSTITSVTDLGSYKVSSVRRLMEFRNRDSLYIFDSADSMMFVLGMEEMKMVQGDYVPFTANWLLKDWPPFGDSDASQAETAEVAGMLCEVRVDDEKVYSLYKGLPVAVQGTDPGDGYRETVVRFVADTVLSDLCFRLPSGFRRVEPSGKKR